MSDDQEKLHAPGSLVLGIIFLLWFIIIYFVQWMALSKTWLIN